MPETVEIVSANKNWEKIVSWALSMMATVALLIGAWFFSSLDEGLKTLKEEIGSLRVQIAVLKVSQEDLRSLESKTATKFQLENLKRRFSEHEKLDAHRLAARDLDFLKLQLANLKEKIENIEARLPN